MGIRTSFALNKVSLAVVVMISTMFLSGCKKKNEPPPLPPSQPHSASPQQVKSDGPESLPDLVITDVHSRIMEGQPVIEITVQNTGQATASGIEGTCSYSCTSRAISVSNQSFLQSGYLTAGRSVTGKLAVTPCPDTVIQVDCTIDPNNNIRELNKQNNHWSGQVKIH